MKDGNGIYTINNGARYEGNIFNSKITHFYNYS